MSNTRATKIPNIPAIRKSGDEGAFYDAVKEALDVAFRRRGDELDGFVRFRDLKDGGIARVNFGGGTIGSLSGTGGGDGGGGIFLTPTPPGTNPPPTGHVNVRTRSVWDGIMILWDWPPGNIEYAYTEIWAAKKITPPGTVPAFTQAILVGSAPGNLFVHTNLGLGAVWYYWLRYVGFRPPNNPTGPAPMSLFTPSQVGPGVRGETAVDPTYVLAVLSGQIAEDQLAIGLGDRINLTDHWINPTTGLNEPLPTDIGTLPIQTRLLNAVRDSETGVYAAIEEEATLRRRDANTIAGSYSIRIDLNNYVTGFGLIATSTTNPDNPLAPPTTSSAFVVRANRFAVVFPDSQGDPLSGMVPFVVGLVNNVSTVGINGQLVVDGSITARTIQANSIGANEINVTNLWAGIMSANRVFASTFATRGDLSYRVELNGSGTQGDIYPIWVGKGATGGSDSVFYLERDGSLKLAGNLTVTGVGRFSTADGGSNDARVEIGGNDGMLLWAGSGVRNTANAKFYFDSNGTLVIRGNPVTFPVGSGSGNSEPSASLTIVPVDGVVKPATVPVLVMARTTVSAGSALYEKTIRTGIFMDSVERVFFASSTQDYSFSEVQFTVINVPNVAANRVFKMKVTIPAVSSDHQIPPVSYTSSYMFAIQLAASS